MKTYKAFLLMIEDGEGGTVPTNCVGTTDKASTLVPQPIGKKGKKTPMNRRKPIEKVV